jgi:hypothetical protein
MLLLPVSYGGECSSKCFRKLSSVPLSAFLGLQEKSSTVNMTKKMHYPIFYDLQGYAWYNCRSKSGNYELRKGELKGRSKKKGADRNDKYLPQRKGIYS